MSLVTNNSEQAKVWVNGRYLPATKASNGEWFVVIDGKRVKVDKNDLFGELIEKNNEKINYLKSKGEALKAQFKCVQKQYYGLLSKFGVDKYSDIDDEAQKAEAKKFYSDLSDLKMAKTANSNREYSAYMTAFDYALEKGNWQNQLNLAEHVQNSIWS